MKIAVIGIGYVGAVTSACLCESGHQVIAIDKEEAKISCIRNGQSPIVEKDLSDLIAKHAKAGRLSATDNIKEAVAQSDISLICVGTPSRADGSLDLSYVQTACEEIGKVIKEGNSFHTVVLRSTMVPGSAMQICLPILERASGKKAGQDFGFGNNPEFLREGSAIYDYYNPPKIVVGANDDRTAAAIMALYDGIDAPRVVTDVAIAEGVKYADNAWHAMKVGFANEMGNILSECGVDSHKVMDIFCLDTKLNISKAYLKPGFAFGGSCLPKDVRAIRAKGKDLGLNTPLFDSLMIANDNQIHRAYQKIKASGKQSVVMLGLSFKAGTDDLRESPLVTLAAMLLKDNIALQIFDPNVQAAKQAKGANHHYINHVITDISNCLIEDSKGLNPDSLFVIGNGNKDFVAVLSDYPQAAVLDLVRLDQSLESRKNYAGICW